MNAYNAHVWSSSCVYVLCAVNKHVPAQRTQRAFGCCDHRAVLRSPWCAHQKRPKPREAGSMLKCVSLHSSTYTLPYPHTTQHTVKVNSRRLRIARTSFHAWRQPSERHHRRRCLCASGVVLKHARISISLKTIILIPVFTCDMMFECVHTL